MVCSKNRNLLLVIFSLFFLFSTAPVHAEEEKPEIQRPVVIVPGMMASFDKKLMYQDIEDNKWGLMKRPWLGRKQKQP
jgi:hypothetical protein